MCPRESNFNAPQISSGGTQRLKLVMSQSFISEKNNNIKEGCACHLRRLNIGQEVLSEFQWRNCKNDVRQGPIVTFFYSLL